MLFLSALLPSPLGEGLRVRAFLISLTKLTALLAKKVAGGEFSFKMGISDFINGF